MGTWGSTAFQNDFASDWLYELYETSDLSLIESSLATVISTKDYLEAPEGEVGIAAAEVVACLQGRPDPKAPKNEELETWVANCKVKPGSALVERAKTALDRIIGKNSELYDLWRDSTEFDE